MALLAFAVALILQGLGRGAYALALATNRLRAYEFASAKLSDLELAGDAGKTSGRFRMGADAFDWTVDAAPLPDDAQLELVTLTIGWHQGRRDYDEHVSAVRRLPPMEK